MKRKTVSQRETAYQDQATIGTRSAPKMPQRNGFGSSKTAARLRFDRETYLSPMLCETCHAREATVHLTSVSHVEGQDQGTERKQHFCKECADEYFARTLPMNPFRGLICLSDEYRSKLYDLLEKAHPEAFDNSDTEACRAGSELMRKFLRENLVKDSIEMNEQAFEMLLVDFIGSYHFYDRVDKSKKGKG